MNVGEERMPGVIAVLLLALMLPAPFALFQLILLALLGTGAWFAHQQNTTTTEETR